ncbi:MULTISPECIES: MFS transporter [unclassified Streptomyces]|uniref:MFS transporter n=1 Tax=Streptomyces TaxID=1883 RepID=UPI00140EC17E|nr:MULTISPECIES: MFS transporter [unclassified Streptomyces]QIK06913.1 MFS transporter [Streptomyces sp. ID38640]UYB40318.1 MFS transporter [Streptomyces sp. Je 1-4]UZQ36427.1 MFS transporter [Streptomyces sp. Je 1-4] [Streptomyces sp. Je 1-4 4N24]UZQ43845.1 MFS transporter [Streptomyces sp. Je 1-4] [Streptomyces sp. Je 1-4 4N24_ara]
MPPADTGASVTDRAAASPQSSPDSSTAAAPDPEAGKLRPGGPGYRRMSFALFAAGVATFALLYSTQALLPAISGDLGVSPDQASWTVSAATFGLALGVIPLSAVSERFGRRTLMTVSLSVAALIAMLVPFAPSLGALIALRGIQGVALAGLPASAMAFLAEEVRAKALVAAIGLFVAGNSIGGMSGRIVTGWVAQAWGWRAALAAVGVLAVVCAVTFRLLVPKARHFAPRSVGPRALARTLGNHLADPLLRRLYAIGGLFMTVFGAVYTVIGYRLVSEPFNLPQGIVGSIFVVYLVGTVSSAAAGQLVARVGRRGALYLAVGTTSTGLLLSLADSVAAVLAGLILITAGFFAGHAVASSSVSRTAKTARAQASALYQCAYYVGSSLGGALGAAAFHAVGWEGTVLLGLAAMLGAASITLYATRKAVAERRLLHLEKAA